MNNRKLQVPVESHSPLEYAEGSRTPAECLLKEADSRVDGRSWNEIRPITIYSDVANNVTGSAYVEVGSTKVTGTVQGPRGRESTKGEELIMEGVVKCDFKFAPFSRKVRANTKQEAAEKYLSNLIGQALKAVMLCELFPRLQVNINLVVLQDDGSVTTCAVLCAAVAMVTAGIPMRDVPTACKVACDNDGHYLCDPTSLEEYSPYSPAHIVPSAPVLGDISVIYAPALNEVLGIHQSGVMGVASCNKGVDVCVEGCVRIKEKVREHMEQRNNNHQHTEHQQGMEIS